MRVQPSCRPELSTSRPLPRRPRRCHPGPGGSGRVTFVSKDDVADVAVGVLLDVAAHAGATYSLTGPRAVSLRELAKLFTRTADRPSPVARRRFEEAYWSRAHFGASQGSSTHGEHISADRHRRTQHGDRRHRAPAEPLARPIEEYLARASHPEVPARPA
jgi:uncharacterized protein YbjT (DUF2867 family)